MNKKMAQRIHRVTTLVTFMAIVFCFFFQISKAEPLREINPFLNDPYDAVGSFAVQAVLLIGILTYARALRLYHAPAEDNKTRLILRGNIFVLCAILLTLISDTVAVILHPLPRSDWGNVLLLELKSMFVLTGICVIALVIVFRRIKTPTPPPKLTPADGIDDLWILVRVPVSKFNRLLPNSLVDWVMRFNCDLFFAKVKWANPRIHPWRFVCILGLLAGVGVVLLQLQEGLPPNLSIGLIVTIIFIFGELGYCLLGFAVFGGYLGLRPIFKSKVHND